MGIIRKKDSAALIAIVMAAAQFIPGEVYKSSPTYQRLLASVPDWVPLVLIGLFGGYWLFHADDRPSRIKALWDRLTKKFEVVLLKAAKFDIEAGHTDVQVKFEVRFTKSGTYRLRLRVFGLIGRGKKPWEHVHDLGSRTVVAGEKMRFDIVDFASPYPGWDHERKRGWSLDRERSLVGNSKNLAVFECEGRMTQSYRMYIEHINHDVGRQVHTPSVLVIGEDEDIWNTDEQNKLGDFRYS